MNSTSFSDTSKFCASCDNALSVADIKLMTDWLLELKPSELGTFMMLCSKCFEKKYPGYLKSKLPPKEIDEWGRFFVVSEAIIWRNAGFDAVDANHWFDLLLEDNGLVDIKVAKEWKQAGFTSENYQDWSGWSKNPKEIATALKINSKAIDEVPAPELSFKDFGFNLSEAIRLAEEGLSPDVDNWSEDYIGNWATGGLGVNELLLLKSQVGQKIDLFEEKHWECRKTVRNWQPEFGSHLPKVLKALREAGVPVTDDNLLRYWGLSKAQILKVIDMGADVKFASSLVRSGISASKVKVVEHLIANGVEEEDAIELTKKGFSIGTLEKIGKNGYSADDLITVVQHLDPLKIDAVTPWLLVDIGSSKYAWIKRIAEWHKFGFVAEDAAEWYCEEFSAKDANAWVKSGAKTPAIAKRRKVAGISPKAVS